MKIRITLHQEQPGDFLVYKEIASLELCNVKRASDFAASIQSIMLLAGISRKEIDQACGIDPAPIQQELLSTIMLHRQATKPGPMQMSTETVMPPDERLTTGTGPEVDCSGVFTTGDSPTADPATEKPPTQVLNVAGIDAGAFGKLGKANGINADIAQRLNKLVNDPHFQNYTVFASGKTHEEVMDAVKCAVDYVQATAFTPSFDTQQPIKFSEKAYWGMIAAFEAWAKDQGITLE